MSVKTLARKHVAYADLLADGECPFSTNKVTGHSLNFPIVGTCSPTVVCGETCYFARGPSTWTPSLKKQHRLMNSIKADPDSMASRIALRARRLGLDFVRWNGGGDLFAESVVCINVAATLMPEIPQWVVTRKPALAARINPRPNVYVHFSVDRSSWGRLDEMRSLAPAGLQWFWSYQCDAGETPPSPTVAPVVFRNCYDAAGEQLYGYDCPLNAAEDITGVCGSCRRCFDGTAVTEAKECHWRPPSPSRS
jgi:hypothetical protein